MGTRPTDIYLFYKCETQRNLEIMTRSYVLSRNDHKLLEQLLSAAGAGAQPRHTQHQRATFSAGDSLLKA